jgi:hypothetical protein
VCNSKCKSKREHFRRRGMVTLNSSSSHNKCCWRGGEIGTLCSAAGDEGWSCRDQSLQAGLRCGLACVHRALGSISSSLSNTHTKPQQHLQIKFLSVKELALRRWRQEDPEFKTSSLSQWRPGTDSSPFLDPRGPVRVADLGMLDHSLGCFLPGTTRIKGHLDEGCCPSPPSITLPLWDQAINFAISAYKSALNIL